MRRAATSAALRFDEPFHWRTAAQEKLARARPDYGLQFFDGASLDTYHADPAKPRLLVEGDSWFNHPLVNDVIDWVEAYQYATYRSDLPGRTLKDMVKQKRYLLPLQDERRDTLRAMLLSGGGNDLISWKKPRGGGASPIFRGGNGSANVAAYIDEGKLSEALTEVAGFLGAIARDVRRVRSDLPIITHAYDWIEPKNYRGFPGSPGEWVNPQLDRVGVPNDGPLRGAIGRFLVDRLNEAWQAACAAEGLTYVNVRGTVRGRWMDEIHPDGDAFLEVAQRLLEAVPGHSAISRVRSILPAVERTLKRAAKRTAQPRRRPRRAARRSRR